jgi:hypothetical protein
MKAILRRIKRNNTLHLRVLKYFFHAYAMFAVIGLLMCPAFHSVGEGTIDYSVIKGRTGIQSVLYKADKKAPSVNPDVCCGPGLDSFVRENQSTNACYSKTVNLSITLLETTRLIL